MSMFRVLMLICAFSLLGGCAFGQKVDYRETAPYLSARSSTAVQVSVVDARPYVLSRNKKPTYVGTLRALYYNPFNVTTLSNEPLSQDIAEAVRKALIRSSIESSVQYASATTAATPGQKLLVIKLSEWKSDTYMRTRFDYDITASVYDEHGKELASKRAQHSGRIDHFIHAGTAALNAVLDSREISDALSATAPAQTVPVGVTPGGTSRYDDCMRRVGKISDAALRLSSMSACDAAQ